MSAVPDHQRIGAVDLRANVIVRACRLRKRAETVDRRKRCRGTAYPVLLLQNLLTKPRKQLIFKSRVLVFGTDNAAFHFLQLLGNVPFARRQRLPAYIVVGHAVQKRPRYLDIISENLVIADLERAYSRPLLFGLLDMRHKLHTVIHHEPELVHCGGRTFFYHSALTHRNRRLRVDGIFDRRCNVLQSVKLLIQLTQKRRIKSAHNSLYVGQACRRTAYRKQITRVRRAVNKARQQPLHIDNALKLFHQLSAFNRRAEKLTDRLLTLSDSSDLRKRLFNPLPEQPCARARFCLVQHP